MFNSTDPRELEYLLEVLLSPAAVRAEGFHHHIQALLLPEEKQLVAEAKKSL